MIEPGGQAGQAHASTLYQGTGLATVLKNDGQGLDTYQRLYMLDDAKRAAADEAARKKQEEAAAKLKAFAPEYFYKHKEKLQPLIEKHLDAGADLLSKKIDPFVSGSPEALAWQKEHQRLTALAQSSMQQKKEFDEFRKDTEGKDLSEFTPNSVDAKNKYFEADLDDVLSGKVTNPILEKKTAWTDASSFVGQNMRLWEQSKPGATDTETLDFVTNLLQEPANADKLKAYAQKFATMDPSEQQRVTDAAKKASIQPFQQMALEDAKRWQKSKEPLNLFEAMNKGAAAAESSLDIVSGSNDKGSYRMPKKGSVMQSATDTANDMFNSHDDWKTIYDRNGELPRMANESDPSYYARVKAHMRDGLINRMKIETEFRKDKAAGDAEKQVQTRNLFVEHIRGNDQVRATAAAKLLIGTKVGNNLVVEEAGVNDIPYRRGLRLELTTPMSLKDVKEEIVSDTGLTSDEVTVEERQGRKLVFIDLGEQGKANQTIARLYDNYVKETGSYYDPSLTEYGVQTATGIRVVDPTKQKSTPQGQKPLDKLFE